MLFTNIVDLSVKNEIIITIFSLFFFLISLKENKKNFFFKNKILNYLEKHHILFTFGIFLFFILLL